MQVIYKIVSYKGQYFVKEYETIKHHKNKVRYLRESTVAKQFKSGDVMISVHFENKNDVINIDLFTDEDIKLKYLGESFI